MRFLQLVCLLPAALSSVVAASAPSTAGITAFVKRRLPHHADSFEFVVSNPTKSSTKENDSYSVSSGSNGKIKVQGTSLSAVMQG